MGNNKKEIDLDEIRGAAGKRIIELLAPKSPNQGDGLTNVEIYNKIYGNKDIDDASKKNKISALRRGEISKNMDELICIAHAMNVSLDWLVFGEGDPPPELQEKEESASDKKERPTQHEENKVDNNEEETIPTEDTVDGLLWALVNLSLCDYVRDFKIEAHGHDFFYHDVKISFSIYPDDDYQSDTVSYLIDALQRFSDSQSLSLPNNDDYNYYEKLAKSGEIVRRIPPNQWLNDRASELEWTFEEECMHCVDLTRKIGIVLPKNY